MVKEEMVLILNTRNCKLCEKKVLMKNIPALEDAGEPVERYLGVVPWEPDLRWPSTEWVEYKNSWHLQAHTGS